MHCGAREKMAIEDHVALTKLPPLSSQSPYWNPHWVLMKNG